LVGIIKCRATCAFVSALQKSAYDELVPPKMKADRAMGVNHYTFAVRMCLGRVIRWRLRYGHREQLRYVFDRLSKGKGEIDAVFERSLSDSSEGALADVGIVRGGWSFEDKSKFIPIQAADLLAWEALHFMKKFSIYNDQFKPRRSYMELTQIPGMHKYYDGPSLTNLVESIKRTRPDLR